MGRQLGYLGWSQRLSEVLQAVGHAGNSWNVIVESGSSPVKHLVHHKGCKSRQETNAVQFSASLLWQSSSGDTDSL